MRVHNRQRAWRLFPGRNRFCCAGRCIMARNLTIFYLTFGLIVFTTLLFFAFDCRLLCEHHRLAPFGGPLITLGAFCLSGFVLNTLLRCSFTDPGIIPRSTPAEAYWLDAEFEAISQQASNAGSFRPPARNKEVIVNRRVLKLKYCYTCRLWRPPRASHCSTCDNCVDRFDHHCPWVGNCVGVRNYRYFFFFISSLSVYCIYIMTFASLNLYLLSEKEGAFLDAFKKSPVSLLEIFIAFISIWSVMGLTGFHTMLVCRDTSTNENIKGTFNTSRNPDLFNPFARKNSCSNCCAILCGPNLPSVLNTRMWIEVDSEGCPVDFASLSCGTSPVNTSVPVTTFPLTESLNSTSNIILTTSTSANRRASSVVGSAVDETLLKSGATSLPNKHTTSDQASAFAGASGAVNNGGTASQSNLQDDLPATNNNINELI